ncbi:MAG: aspartate--tRNA ligase [Balneolaceae bacterium]|nr:aspartate--tRNA ligase [Balneolaceae bacterium]
MVLKRTHTCGELDRSKAGEQVVLNGWVDGRRDFGGLIFIDLRDRYGLTQIVFAEHDQDLLDKAGRLRNEYVIGVRGKVRERDDKNVNPEMATGEIEVLAGELVIYSQAETPPMEVREEVNATEETRLRYRYLDMRRAPVQRNLLFRSRAVHAVRQYFHDHGFAEVETPYLMRSTPEGARDYLVPSRVNPGKFYALPQSPQTYKQILMVSGFDRYFQIAKCFRDEDLRADRQPEFTQVDVELSFVDEEEVLSITEGMMARLMRQTMGRDVELPFPRMTYREAMETYGTDKPDTRFGLEIADLSDLVADAEFRIFSKTVADGGAVLGITVPEQGSLGRGAMDRLTEQAQQETGAKGLIYLQHDPEEGLSCNVGKFLEEETIEAMAGRAGCGEGDLVLILAGPDPEVYRQMGKLRQLAGREFELIDTGAYNFLWVTDFPLVEWDEETGRYHALHHPFTAPREEDVQKGVEPAEIRSRAYDLVLNGYEIGGGSIRIHERKRQMWMFDLLGMDEEESQERFGFLLEAFRYGAPPHGGIALGVDRIAMILTGSSSLRDVIAFPKNQKAQSLMDDSPGSVDPQQLEELHIRLADDLNGNTNDNQTT